MAKNKIWYSDEIITPWRARRSMGIAVITDDQKREQQTEDMMMVDMAIRELLENASVVLRGKKGIPTRVDYFIVDLQNAQAVMIRKYSFYLDESELDALAKDEEVMKRLVKKKGELTKLYKEGRFDIYVEGLSPHGDMRVVTAKLRDLQNRKGGKQMLSPVPMVVKGRGGDATFAPAQNPAEIKQIPLNAFGSYLWKRYALDPPNQTIFTYIKGIKFGVEERDLNERTIVMSLLKNFSKNPAVIRRGGAFVVSLPSIGLIPLALRNNIIISYKSLPTKGEIVQQLTLAINILKKAGKIPKSTKITEELIEASMGLTLKEIHDTITLSAYRYGDIRVDVFRDEKNKKLKNMGVEFVEPKINFSHVGGMKAVKETIFNGLIRYTRHPEIADTYNMPSPRGYLLAGIGGTGKTWIGKAVAGELGRPVILLSASDFMSKYVGESEQNLRNVIHVANQLNAILFIDEIDQVAINRESLGKGDSGVAYRVLSTLLESLGNRDRNYIIVGATNVIDQIDPHFMRAGRFDKIMHVAPPDYKGRIEILKIHALKLAPPKKEIKYEDGVFEKVAKDTALWTGAELELLVTEAKREAASDMSKVITYDHFKSAMQEIQINIEQRKEEIRKQLKAIEELPQGSYSMRTLREGWKLITGKQAYAGKSDDVEVLLETANREEGIEDFASEEDEPIEEITGMYMDEDEEEAAPASTDLKSEEIEEEDEDEMEL